MRVLAGTAPAGVARLLRRVEHLEHALGARDAGLQQVDHRRDLRDGLRELARVLDERGDVTERHLPRRDAHAADDADRDVLQVADEHHDRHHQPRQELRAARDLRQGGVGRRERRLHLRPAPEDLDELVRRERLLDLPVERARVRPLGHVLPLRTLHDLPGDEHDEGNGQQCDDRQLPRDRQHHDDDAEHRADRHEQLPRRLLHRLPDVVDVVRHAREQLAARARVDIGQRHALQLGVDVGAQFLHRPLHDGVEQTRLHDLQQRCDDVERDDGEQDRRDTVEVDARARHEVHRRDHVGECPVAVLS